MILSLILSCQIDNSQPPSLHPRNVAAAIEFNIPQQLETVRLAAVGDILISRGVQSAAEDSNRRNEEGASQNNNGYDAIFSEIRPLIQSADAAFANLATPIAPDNQYRVNNYRFNGSPSLLKSLQKTGFDVLSISNSHSFDQGRLGLRETIERIERSKMIAIGAGRDCVEAKKAHHVKKGDITIAFLAASTVFSNFIDSGVKNICAFKIQRADDLYPFINGAKDQGADIVVVSIHWGSLYKTKPDKATQKLANQIIEAGADVILGHHPGVLQPIEIYQASDGRIGVISYSLGSILSDRGQHFNTLQNASQGNSRDSGILHIDFVKKNYGTEGIQTEITNVYFEPIWLTHNPTENDDPSIFPRLIDDQILRLNSEIEMLEGSSDEKLYKLKELEFLFQRRVHISQTIGNEWVNPLIE